MLRGPDAASINVDIALLNVERLLRALEEGLMVLF